MDIKICKLKPDHAEEYARFFDTTPHWGNDDTKCYCITWCGDNVYKNGGKHWFDSPNERRIHAVKRVCNGDIQGYLAYYNDEIIGWCNANTKSDCKECINYFRTHADIPLEECYEEEKVKFIFCFTVAPKFQRMGVATKLLEYICKDSASDGFDFVESFADKEVIEFADSHRGSLAMYEKCGFSIHAKKGSKVIVRKSLK